MPQQQVSQPDVHANLATRSTPNVVTPLVLEAGKTFVETIKPSSPRAKPLLGMGFLVFVLGAASTLTLMVRTQNNFTPVILATVSLLALLVICALLYRLGARSAHVAGVVDAAAKKPASVDAGSAVKQEGLISFELDKGRLGQYDDLQAQIVAAEKCEVMVYANSLNGIWHGLFRRLLDVYDPAVPEHKLRHLTLRIVCRSCDEDEILGVITRDLRQLRHPEIVKKMLSHFSVSFGCQCPCFTGIAINREYVRLRFRQKPEMKGKDGILWSRNSDLIDWFIGVYERADKESPRRCDILADWTRTLPQKP
jgi:hypothetical protein